jgi:hypothetical protein
MKLRTLQQPSRLETLLESLVLEQHWISQGAGRVDDRSELPSCLQRLAINAVKNEGGWRAWLGHDGMRLFVAEMSLELSRERGVPALKVRYYDHDGRLQNFSLWVQLADGAWQRCAL